MVRKIKVKKNDTALQVKKNDTDFLQTSLFGEENNEVIRFNEIKKEGLNSRLNSPKKKSELLTERINFRLTKKEKKIVDRLKNEGINLSMELRKLIIFLGKKKS